MPKIVCDSPDTDVKLMNCLDGYIAQVSWTEPPEPEEHSVEIEIAGTEFRENGFLWLVGFEWDEESGDSDQDREVSVPYEQITEINVY